MVVAPVKRQEVGFLALEWVVIHTSSGSTAKWTRARFLKAKRRSRPVPVVLILAHRIGSTLSGQRILEFGSDDGDTVNRKGHVNDTAAIPAVRPLHYRGEPNLARDRQPVLGI